MEERENAHQITQMRDAIKKKYPSPSLVKKINLMPPEQVRNLYGRLKRNNKI